MKKIIFTISLAVVAVSCSEEQEIGKESIEAVTYSLDKENSSIEWRGIKDPEYFHTGTIALSEGSLIMMGDSVTGGSFTIDMTSIKNTDLEGERAVVLEMHLKGLDSNEYQSPMDFFRTKEYPSATVEVTGYTNGKLTAKMMIIGTTLDQEIPVELNASDDSVTISGDFSYDFAPFGINMLQANPETGDKTGVELTLNVRLTK